ncbi:hypothetical protein EJ08DRAFT_467230 [Tothia fuscella]|uniref:Uncharacterized protein n=1 Tax=Tothia fuscella TaxID=1048955 RepID=A0A9P4NZE0_9PEZI|nr:hypothetical protein EJ08DRAFT_467230 [Tothia fuscella]
MVTRQPKPSTKNTEPKFKGNMHRSCSDTRPSASAFAVKRRGSVRIYYPITHAATALAAIMLRDRQACLKSGGYTSSSYVYGACFRRHSCTMANSSKPSSPNFRVVVALCPSLLPQLHGSQLQCISLCFNPMLYSRLKLIIFTRLLPSSGALFHIEVSISCPG